MNAYDVLCENIMADYATNMVIEAESEEEATTFLQNLGYLVYTVNLIPEEDDDE